MNEEIIIFLFGIMKDDNKSDKHTFIIFIILYRIKINHRANYSLLEYYLNLKNRLSNPTHEEIFNDQPMKFTKPQPPFLTKN